MELFNEAKVKINPKKIGGMKDNCIIFIDELKQTNWMYQSEQNSKNIERQ